MPAAPAAPDRLQQFDPAAWLPRGTTLTTERVWSALGEWKQARREWAAAHRYWPQTELSDSPLGSLVDMLRVERVTRFYLEQEWPPPGRPGEGRGLGTAW